MALYFAQSLLVGRDFFRQKIKHLACAHSVASRALCKLRSGFYDVFRRNLPAVGRKGRFKSKGLKSVSRKQSGILCKGHMAGGLSPSHIIVVHTGQIVVDQGIGMDHFDGTGKGQGDFFVFSANSAKFLTKGSSYSLSAAEQRISHSLNKDFIIFRALFKVSAECFFGILRIGIKS